MTRTTQQWGRWPTEQQLMLLRAALWEGPSVLDAWQAWSAHADIGSLDQGSYRLLPLLYHNLHAHGVTHPWMDTLKGIYRRTWFTNQILFHAITPALELLHQADIPMILLKGVSLTLLYYRDYGLRPMSDVDILVPTSQAIAAFALLKAHGWKLKKENQFLNRIETVENLSWGHAFHCVNEQGNELDLHWRILSECIHPLANEHLWSDAVPTTLAGVPMAALRPEHLLLNVCLHGTQWNEVPPIRWIADAMIILRVTPAIDWEYLLDSVRQYRMGLPMCAALTYLSHQLHAPVPDEVLDQLRSLPTSFGERWLYRASLQSGGNYGPLTAFFRVHETYRRSLVNTDQDYTLTGFSAFLRHRLRVRHLWHLPLHLGFRAVRQVAYAMLHRVGLLEVR